MLRTSQQHFLLVKSLWGDLLMGPALKKRMKISIFWIFLETIWQKNVFKYG